MNSKINLDKGEFSYCFKITAKVVFEVKNYTLSPNLHNYLSMVAGRFDPRYTDYDECGQCQEHVLPHGCAAYKFWSKWKHRHTIHLTDRELAEVKNDIEELKQTYEFIESEWSDISFYKIVDMCKNSK